MQLKKVFDLVPKLALAGAFGCALVIAVLSLLPGSDLPSANMNDKLNHFIAYGVLMTLAVLGRHGWSFWRVGGLIILYGLALEGLQGAMPYGRSASWHDAIANTGGVLVGLVFGGGVQSLLSRFAKI